MTPDSSTAYEPTVVHFNRKLHEILIDRLQAIRQRLDVMADQQLLILQHLGASPSPPTEAKARSPRPTPGQHAGGPYAHHTPTTVPLYPGWQLVATPGTPPTAGPLQLAGAGPTSRSPHVWPAVDHQTARVDLPGMEVAPAGPLVPLGQEVLVQQPVGHEGRGTRRARAHVAAVEAVGTGVQTRQQARQSAQSQGAPTHAGNAGVQLPPVAGDQDVHMEGAVDEQYPHRQHQQQPLPPLPSTQQGAGTAGSAEQGRGSARRRQREGQAGEANAVGGAGVWTVGPGCAGLCGPPTMHGIAYSCTCLSVFMRCARSCLLYPYSPARLCHAVQVPRTATVSRRQSAP